MGRRGCFIDHENQVSSEEVIEFWINYQIQKVLGDGN